MGDSPDGERSRTIRLPPRNASSSLSVEEAHLVVRAGDQAGLEIPCGTHRVRIGTARDNDLVLVDKAVSHHHAVLEPVAGGIVLRDLGSTNGTFLADVQIREAFVRPGELIRVGSTTLLMKLRKRRDGVPPSSANGFGRLVGQSLKMRQLFTLLGWVAPTETSLLITGPTGTGKEVVARSVHEESPRRAGPFVVVDCGALDPELISSELFGHEPGAFTGASGRRIGAFEQADGGTVFLDEIGELPLDLQPKLLRVLDAREVRRLGGNASIPLDLRVLAATNRDLESMVSGGRFREDLYWRLCQVKVVLPSLQERREDIPLLIESFLRTLPAGAPPRSMSPEAVALISQGRFPGNVRQLRMIVERAAMVSQNATIDRSDLAVFGDLAGPAVAGSPAGGASEPQRDVPAGPASERERIVAELVANRWVLAHTARALGIALNTLKARMRQHGIARPLPGQTPAPGDP